MLGTATEGSVQQHFHDLCYANHENLDVMQRIYIPHIVLKLSIRFSHIV